MELLTRSGRTIPLKPKVALQDERKAMIDREAELPIKRQAQLPGNRHPYRDRQHPRVRRSMQRRLAQEGAQAAPIGCWPGNY